MSDRPMRSELGLKNIVLVGFFSVEIFDRYFFIKNNIITENDISPFSVFANTQGIVQILSSRVQIAITQQQIIISSLQYENNEKLEIIADIIIRQGNVNSITSFGINFHWYLSDDSRSIEELSREYFYKSGIELFEKYFNNNNSQFGVYASTNVKDSRLKLDVKPSRISIIGGVPKNIINFIFNFHFDIKDIMSSNEEFLKALGDYNLYFNESRKIISIYS